MANRGEEEPDWARACSFSRRHALALGAAAMGTLAGCNSVSRSGDAPATDQERDHERTIKVQNLSIDSVGYHIMGGLLDLQKPDKPYDIWPDHPSPNAAGEFTFDTEQGSVTTVECTWPDPTIGWKNPDGSEYELLSYLSDTGVYSALLLNEDNEPDVDGTLRMSVQQHIVPWEAHTTEYPVIDDIENFRAS